MSDVTEEGLEPEPGWESTETAEPAPSPVEEIAPPPTPGPEAPPPGVKAKRSLRALARSASRGGDSSTTATAVSSQEFSEAATAIAGGLFNLAALFMNRRFGRADDAGGRDDLWVPLPDETDAIARGVAAAAGSKLPAQVTSSKGGELLGLLVPIIGYVARNLMGTTASQVAAIRSQMAGQGGPGGPQPA